MGHVFGHGVCPFEHLFEEIGEKESTRMNCLTIVIAYTRPQELSRENTQDVRM